HRPAVPGQPAARHRRAPHPETLEPESVLASTQRHRTGCGRVPAPRHPTWRHRAMRALSLTLILLTLTGCATLASGDLVELQRQADSAYSDADYARASELYERLARALPTDAGVRFQRGNSLARQGDHAGAIASYRDALTRDPQHARAWHNLLQVQLQEARLTASEMQRYLSAQSPHADLALKRAERLLEASP